MTAIEIKEIQDHDLELVSPMLGFEIEANKKGFSVNVKIVEGELQVSLSHKWFPIPVVFLRLNIVEKILRPLGMKVKNWFRKKGVIVYVLEKQHTGGWE